MGPGFESQPDHKVTSHEVIFYLCPTAIFCTPQNWTSIILVPALILTGACMNIILVIQNLQKPGFPGS